MIQVGSKAPGFKLEALVGDKFKNVSLSDYVGKWVVLFYYPMDFTFICPTEIKEFNKHYSAFKKLRAEVLGASTDSKYSHLAWTEHELGKLNFPLLSDHTQEVARAYGILLEDQGIALRGTFIIDPKGNIRYHLVHDDSVGRSVQETLRVLEALQTGMKCPVEWKHGQKTLGKV